MSVRNAHRVRRLRRRKGARDATNVAGLSGGAAFGGASPDPPLRAGRGWKQGKIEAGIRKAFLSLGADTEPAASLAQRVSERAQSLGLTYVPIETVQDLVQEELVLAGHMRVAERYIVYRLTGPTMPILDAVAARGH